MRTEQDNLGSVQIAKDTLYGINTERALENFSLMHKRINLNLIHSLAQVKKAAALTYEELGVREQGIYTAIAQACDAILTGAYDDSFPVQALQGGAGTSTNLNVDEVVANLALKILGYPYGTYSLIHPVDDVNRGQSTNDAVPTALHLAAIQMLQELVHACTELQMSLLEKEKAYADIQKLGRTELEDAVPITLGQEFGAYAAAIARDCRRLTQIQERLLAVNLGGTAVGVSDTASQAYRQKVLLYLKEVTGLPVYTADNLMDATQNNDILAETSGVLKTLAVNLMKIANDLRLMNGGPHGGLGEIRLKAMQQGSSIMPGKVNPVIPEMTMQCAMRVIANDTAITMAAAHGEFELNAFFPLMADALLESLQLLTRTVIIFRTRAIEVLEANPERCRHNLEASAAFGTAYIDKLGYDTVSHILKTLTPAEARKKLDSLLAKEGQPVYATNKQTTKNL